MPQSNQYNVRERVAVLYQQRWWLALFCGSAMLSSLALTYVYAERYRAVATLLYRPTEHLQFQSQQKESLGFPVPMLPFEVIADTIGQLGTSEVILREVVERLDLDKPKKKTYTGLAKIYQDTKDWVKRVIRRTKEVLKYGRFIEKNPTSSAIIELASNVSVETTRKNYTILVEAVAKNPHQAAIIVDVWGDVMVRMLREENARVARVQGEELDRLLVVKKAELDSARQELEALKAAENFVELETEVGLNLHTTEQFERVARETEVDLAEARARLDELVAQRQLLEPMVRFSEMRADDPLFQELRALKSKREIEREGLLKRFPADHLEIATIEAELAAINQVLAKVDEKRTTSESTQLNEVHQQLLGSELELRAKLAGLQSARTALRNTLRDLRGRFGDPTLETRHRDIQLRLEILEEAYTKLSQAREEARLAESRSQSEIRVLHKATPQDTPFRPIKIYHVLASGILALLIGVGAVYLVDFWMSLWNAAGEKEAAT